MASRRKPFFYEFDSWHKVKYTNPSTFNTKLNNMGNLDFYIREGKVKTREKEHTLTVKP